MAKRLISNISNVIYINCFYQVFCKVKFIEFVYSKVQIMKIGLHNMEYRYLAISRPEFVHWSVECKIEKFVLILKIIA